jgi:hypothetical protein
MKLALTRMPLNRLDIAFGILAIGVVLQGRITPPAALTIDVSRLVDTFRMVRSPVPLAARKSCRCHHGQHESVEFGDSEAKLCLVARTKIAGIFDDRVD